MIADLERGMRHCEAQAGELILRNLGVPTVKWVLSRIRPERAALSCNRQMTSLESVIPLPIIFSVSSPPLKFLPLDPTTAGSGHILPILVGATDLRLNRREQQRQRANPCCLVEIQSVTMLDGEGLPFLTVLL